VIFHDKLHPAEMGDSDRVTMLPASSKQDLIDHPRNVRNLHERVLREGAGRTKLPDALARKYPMRIRSGDGNSCFRQVVATLTAKPASSGATTWMSR
jgi:hypothetical protein